MYIHAVADEERIMAAERRVREPVQVYLDKSDRALLKAVAERSALPASEVLRVALRRLAADLPPSDRPGGSLASLVGSLDAAGGVPRDLSARHDEYLYGKPARNRKRKP
jgi:hypothetical protein